MSRSVTALLALAAATALSALSLPCLAAPQSMTRSQIIDLAKTGVGYSYWWGHGAWRADGADPGSCSGSCPSCTHTGSYGADCSGFAGKVWQLPSPSALDDDQHPYSTLSFRNDFTYWTQIDWSEVKMADAFVRNDGSSGHIFIYESGDAWGDVWAYECKSCALGCVHDLRSITADYIAIRRDLVEDDPVAAPDAGPEAEPPQDATPIEEAAPEGEAQAAVEQDAAPDVQTADAGESEVAQGDDAASGEPEHSAIASRVSGIEEDASCACRAAGRASGRGRGAAWLAGLCLAAVFAHRRGASKR